MTTAEEIGRDFVEALEEVNWPIDEPFYKTECPFKRPSDEECIHVAVANVEDILYPKSMVVSTHTTHVITTTEECCSKKHGVGRYLNNGRPHNQ